MTEQKETTNKVKKGKNTARHLVTGLLIAGSFLGGLYISDSSGVGAADKKAPEPFMNFEKMGYGEEFKEVKPRMKVEEVDELFDVDDNEDIVVEEFEDDIGGGLMVSIEKPIGDEGETHQNYFILSQGEVHRIADYITLKEENSEGIFADYLAQLTEEFGEYTMYIQHIAEHEGEKGYTTEYNWDDAEEGIVRTLMKDMSRDGKILIVKDLYTYEPIVNEMSPEEREEMEAQEEAEREVENKTADSEEVDAEEVEADE